MRSKINNSVSYLEFLQVCNTLSDFANHLSDNYWEEDRLYSENVYKTFLHEYSLSCHIAHLVSFDIISPSILGENEIEAIYELYNRHIEALDN